jgi:hypothetical protein
LIGGINLGSKQMTRTHADGPTCNHSHGMYFQQSCMARELLTIDSAKVRFMEHHASILYQIAETAQLQAP